MKTNDLKSQLQRVFLVLISVLFYSCTKNENNLIELILNDFKNIDNSKNIIIDIKEDSIKNKYYFILEEGNNEEFEVPYYTFNFKDFKIKMLNYNTTFDIKLLGKIDLDLIKPKSIYYGRDIIDDFNEKKISIYEIHDSILVKRMSFDVNGNLIEEKKILKKWK